MTEPTFSIQAQPTKIRYEMAARLKNIQQGEPSLFPGAELAQKFTIEFEWPIHVSVEQGGPIELRVRRQRLPKIVPGVIAYGPYIVGRGPSERIMGMASFDWMEVIKAIVWKEWDRAFVNSFLKKKGAPLIVEKTNRRVKKTTRAWGSSKKSLSGSPAPRPY